MKQILALHVCALMLALLTGCKTPTRAEIDATVWLNNAHALRDDKHGNLCKHIPELANFGFYRRLNSGKLEFISFCNPAANQMLAIPKSDYERILNEYLPKP